MTKVLLVYNTSSGTGSVKSKIDMIIERFSREGMVVTCYRFGKTNGIDIVELFQRESFQIVVIAGGDGTINFVVNNMFKAKVDIPVGIIPAGTSNDFAASVKIEGNIQKSLEIIFKNKPRYVDIGLLDKKTYFVGTCAGGIFVNVSYSTSNDFKKALGPTAYYIKALTEVGTFKPFKIKLEFDDGKELNEEVLLFFITNGMHAGGFTQLIKKADIHDGLMDIVLIKNCLNVELIGLFIKAVTNNLLDDKNVIHIKTRNCMVKSEKEIVLSVDGEKGDILPVSFEVISDKLKIFLP